MFTFTPQQRMSTLGGLTVFHILIIASSNYLVQLPIVILGLHTTWGAFTFPFIFLATDLIVRIFGASLARRIVFVVMLPALVISYVVSTLFFQGAWQGLSVLSQFNWVVARIALASFMAYILGQILDVHVFNRLRRRSTWWVAPAVSTLFGNASDTFSFFFIAFYRSSDPFMAANWIEIAWVDYTFKLLIGIILFLPLYAIMLNGVIKYCFVKGAFVVPQNSHG